MSATSSVRRAWGVMVAERGVAGVASLASLGLLARQLDAHAFGAWVLASTAWTVAESCRAGLVQGAFLRHHAAAEPGARGDWILAAALLGAVGSLAGALLGCGVALASADAAALELLLATPVVLGAAWLVGQTSLVLQARGRFGALLAVRTITSTAWIAGLVGARDPATVVTAWAGAQLLGGLAGALLTLPGTPRPRAAPVRPLAAHGGFGLATLVGSSLYRSADLGQIGAALGPAATGLYAQALRPVDLVEIPLQAAATVLAPKLAADAARAPKAAVTRAARAGLAVSALAVALSAPIFVFAPQILTLLVGHADPTAVLVLRVLLLTNPLRPLDRLLGLTLDACGHPGLNAVKVWIGLALDVLVNVVALRMGGADALPAVAIGSVLATLGSLALGEALLRRAVGSGLLGSLPLALHPPTASTNTTVPSPRIP